MHITERIVVVTETMDEELNDQETDVELRKHSNGIIFTVFILHCQTKQQNLSRTVRQNNKYFLMARSFRSSHLIHVEKMKTNRVISLL